MDLVETKGEEISKPGNKGQFLFLGLHPIPCLLTAGLLLRFLPSTPQFKPAMLVHGLMFPAGSA